MGGPPSFRRRRRGRIGPTGSRRMARYRRRPGRRQRGRCRTTGRTEVGPSDIAHRRVCTAVAWVRDRPINNGSRTPQGADSGVRVRALDPIRSACRPRNRCIDQLAWTRRRQLDDVSRGGRCRRSDPTGTAGVSLRRNASSGPDHAHDHGLGCWGVGPAGWWLRSSSLVGRGQSTAHCRHAGRCRRRIAAGLAAVLYRGDQIAPGRAGPAL